MNNRLISYCIFSLFIFIPGCSNKKEQESFQIPQPAFDEKISQVSFSDFIGSKQCQSCHPNIYSQWENSTHAKAGGSPTDVVVIAPFNGNSIQLSDVTIYPEKKGNNYQFRLIDNTTGDQQIIKVEAVVGGGFMYGGGTQTYFGEFEDGTYRFLPFDFSRDENAWFVQVKNSEEWKKADKRISMSQLYNWPPHRVLGEIEDISNCQNCHGSQIVGEKVGETYNTQFTTLAINCESCHGPAKKHVTTMAEIVSGMIANPTTIGIKSIAGISPRESLNICFQCHAVKAPIKNAYLPGQNLEEFYSLRLTLLGNENPYAIDGRIKTFGYQQNHLFSDCFINGSMTCISCHNPHSQNYQDINRQILADRFDDRQCTACHMAKKENISIHTFHNQNSTGSKCISCHMPFRQHEGIGSEIRFTRSDHTVSIPRPVYDQSQGFESACIQCHADQTEEALQTFVDQWWKPAKPMNPVIANRLSITKETSQNSAAELLLNPDEKHSMGQYVNLSYFIKRYLSPGMENLDRKILNKLMDYAEIKDDIDLKSLALAGLHYSQYNNPEVQMFLIEQLEKMGTTEEAIRLRWGMILDYFGTVFYLVGDRPRAIECYELAKQVLPNDKKIAENIVRAKS